MMLDVVPGPQASVLKYYMPRDFVHVPLNFAFSISFRFFPHQLDSGRAVTATTTKI